MKHTVSFIGLGVMGYPMAAYLAKAGHDVRVFNRTTRRAEQWVRDHGGVIWRVERDDAGLKGELGDDASETEQQHIKSDLTFANNADLRSFADEVVLAYRDLVGGKLEVEV